MIRRIWAFALMLLAAPAAMAGVNVTLEPVANPPYTGNQTVTVEVFAAIDPPTGAFDDFVFLRMIQFDFNNSDPELTLGGAFTWTACSGIGSCEAIHFVESALGPASRRPGLASYTHRGNLSTGDLGPSTSQMFLRADGTMKKVGELQVTLPDVMEGTFTLDAMNIPGADDNNGGQVRLGFGLDPMDPITTWLAGTADLTGGTFDFTIGEAEDMPLDVVRWDSIKEHGGGVGDVNLEIPDNGDFTEPRLGGITELVLTYESEINPDSVSPAVVSISGCTIGDAAVDLSGIAIGTSVQNSNELVVTFNPALPGSGFNEDPVRYVMTVADVAGPGGTAGGGANNSRAFRAQLADVNGDRIVNTNDINGARTIRDLLGGAPIDPDEPNQALRDFMIRADVNLNGLANTDDMNAVRTIRDDAGENNSTGITCP